MSKKYLVYVSSALDDLRAERREIIRIIYEIGAIPVAMDVFDLTNEEDLKIIEKAIGECDYFLNITAYKGGEGPGKSLALQIEYDYAVKAGIPVLALIIGEKARWKDSKKEKSPSAVKALNAFKKKLAAHTHDSWMNLADLKQKALFLLSREMNLGPRRGWVPSTLAVDPSVANELSRLIRENEFLKSKYNIEGIDIVSKVREQIADAIKVLMSNRISLSFYYTNSENWENTTAFRYVKLFKLLSPELSTTKSAADISRFLGNVLNPDLEKVIRKDFPIPSNTIKKMMADFTALKLTRCLGMPSSDGSGDYEVWELTEYGKETFAALRLRQMTSKEHPQAQKEPAGEV